MATDFRLQSRFAEEQARSAALRAETDGILQGGGGGGTSGGVEDRVTRLELQMEQVGKSLNSIDGKLDKVNDRLNLLPTKSELFAWKWQWTALAFAVVAIVIGGIIGGLSWIKPDAPAASSPAPVVIQMPATPKGS